MAQVGLHPNLVFLIGVHTATTAATMLVIPLCVSAADFFGWILGVLASGILEV